MDNENTSFAAGFMLFALGILLDKVAQSKLVHKGRLQEYGSFKAFYTSIA